MDAEELWMTALLAVGAFLLLLVVVRLMGKRAIGNLSPFDLVVALVIGSLAKDIIYEKVPFAQGAVAIFTLGLVQYLTSWLTFRSRRASRIIEGEPITVVKNGQFFRAGMKSERLTEDEIRAELRLKGIDDLGKVKLAQVENDGKLSVLRQDWAEPLEKGDAGAAASGKRG